MFSLSAEERQEKVELRQHDEERATKQQSRYVHAEQKIMKREMTGKEYQQTTERMKEKERN